MKNLGPSIGPGQLPATAPRPSRTGLNSCFSGQVPQDGRRAGRGQA